MSKKLPPEVLRAREQWKFRGESLPEFAVEPGEDQESVWDYPRPPRVVEDSRRVVVRRNDTVIADSTRAVRVLETASPPTFYLPPDDIQDKYLEMGIGESLCEWKGAAQYWSVRIGDNLFENVAWSYLDPYPGFESIQGYLSFYPARLLCVVGEEQAHPQPGGFYGGWVTSDVTGPFKGAPGTEWW